MVLVKDLRVLYLDLQAAGKRQSLDLSWGSETSKPTPIDTFPPTKPHYLILSNSATPL